MIKITAMMIVCVILAYQSERYTDSVLARGRYYNVMKDRAFVALVIILILFAGLRREYNDTWNYIVDFRRDEGLDAFLANRENLNILKNPLYYFYRSFLRDLTDNDQILIFIPAVFTQISFMLFFKRYSHSFTFSVFLYFALGTINVSLAAMKQVWAMAIVTLAFPYLEKKQWMRYYIIVFIAMLMHTYALAFAVLPLFSQRPWKPFTYIFVAVLVFVMMNFEGTISAFMDQAEEVGKKLYAEEIFDNYGVNILRVAVYAVAPLISFLFRRWIFRNSGTGDHIVVHMSIISFAFMLMGTQSGANMFARMAHYFELGTVCCIPWMLKKTFDKRSYQLVSVLTVCCFLVYFVYANSINLHFDSAYKANSIFSLLGF